MIGTIVMCPIGIIFVIVGYLLWKKQKITLLHSYHYNKVSEQDKKEFCILSGIGVILIGIGIIATGIIIGITDSAWSFIAFLVGFSIGIGMLIYAGMKYNRGI